MVIDDAVGVHISQRLPGQAVKLFFKAISQQLTPPLPESLPLDLQFLMSLHQMRYYSNVYDDC